MSFLHKKADNDAAGHVSAAEEVHDTSTGTMEDVEAVMKKYDRESNVRVWEGIPGQVIRWLMAGFSLFCLYLTLFDKSLPEKRLTLFLGLIIIIGYLNFPMRKNHVKPNSVPWYDVIIMVVGAFPFFYFAFNAQDILLKSYNQLSKDPFMLTIAIIGILALVILFQPELRRILERLGGKSIKELLSVQQET